MGQIGEIFALAGLQVDTASFAQYGAALEGAESGVSDFASNTQALLAGAFALPAVALAGIASYGVGLASNFQDAGTTLTTLYGTADLAKQKFQWMTDFAASTPFQFDEVVQGGIKLKSYGMDIEQYGKTFGDTASGMGKSFNDVIEAVADAQTGEFERLKELGIKAVQVTKANLDQYAQYGGQVGDTMLTYVNRSGQQMAQAVDKNNREMITSTLSAIWNEKYAGAMETRSQTLSGMMSTLKDNLTFGLADLVGYDMKNMEVQTASLMGVLMELSKVAIVVTGSVSNLSEPAQTFAIVAAVGGSAALLLAGGLIAASAAGITTAGVMGALGLAVGVVLGPATLIVGALALVAAGFVYLDEQTGAVTAVWNALKDVFTIVFYNISAGFTIFKTKAIADIQEIQEWFSNLLPPGVVTAITGAIAMIQGKFGEWAAGTKAHAESLKQANTDTAASFDKYSNINMAPTGAQLSTMESLVQSLGADAKTGTTALEGMGNVPAPGSIAGLTGIDTGARTATTSGAGLKTTLEGAGNVPATGSIAGLVGIQQGEKNATAGATPLQTTLTATGNVSFAGTNTGIVSVDANGKKTTFTVDQLRGSMGLAGNVPFTGSVSGLNGVTFGTVNANAGAKTLTATLTASGQVSYYGTTSQLSLVNAKGEITKLTVSQLETYLKQSGNVSLAGTQGQIALVDAAGKRTNLTTQEATNLLKTAGSQSMSGTIGGVNGITAAWGKATAAANAYAKAAIAQRETEKTYESAMKGSTSTGQSSGGVTVVGAGQSIKSTNNVTVNNTYNQPTASDKKGQLAIIGRS